ncbi:hypothetical protein GALL_446220 [mine drainage metagenome]|uniref:Novel STAND NTPase 3 domain-containing protein n=1 Tax=mine drainage metagenome TaxID=410659 RepID=A0A1J5Q8D3_9ZZZZ
MLANNQDTALMHFIDAIRTSSASRFILTTREHILRKAMGASEKLQGGSLLNHRCLLELRDYSFGQKARILYNHLYFSDLPIEYKAAIVQNEFYFRIIRHRNFNPRLVEWLSGYARIKTVPASEYQDHVIRLLNNPEEIWSHAFEYQISEAARNVLFCLATKSYSAEREVLEPVWKSLHDLKSHKYNFARTPLDFRRALNDLEASFIKISDQRITLLNPSIRDFLQNLFRRNKDYGEDLVEAAVHFSQIRTLWDICNARPTEVLSAVLSPQPKLIESLKRVISAPHIRFKKDSDGRFVATHIDDMPHSRVCTLIEWAENTKSMEICSLIDQAQQFHENYWKELTVYIPGILTVLRELETSPWVYENGGSKLHEALITKVLESLAYARTYDWRTVLDYRATSSYWSAAHEAEFSPAFQEYRRQGVFDEFEDCQELSDLESMADGLRDIQKTHKQVFKRIIKRIRVAIDEKKKGLDYESDDYQPVPEPKKLVPENDEDVRHLFGSLFLV